MAGDQKGVPIGDKKSKAVILLSGGMDSCVTAAIANLTHRLAVLHVSYGQRTERREANHENHHFGPFAGKKAVHAGFSG